LSLAKYLFIAAKEDDQHLSTHDIEAFLTHILERIDLTRDVHFYTNTTIDTLDYSGDGLNSGSKVVVAAAGDPKRELWNKIPEGLKLSESFYQPKIAMPGVLVLESNKYLNLKKQLQKLPY
jgi:4-hydroxy-3-polyprenylbenzoate decarboxylase